MHAATSSTGVRPRRGAKLPRIAVGVALLLLGGLAVAIAWGLIFRDTYPTTQTVERSFVLEDDFTSVRKILVRTDASKQIVTMTGDSTFLDQQWNTVGGGLNAESWRDLSWRLQLEGVLEVRTNDPYIGQHEITLAQEVHIDPDQVHSNVELTEPSQRLRQYEMTVWFQRQGGHTLVRQRLKQEIVTDAPWFAHAIADRRVYESAERALVNQEAAIRLLVEDNRGKWLLLR